MDTNHKLTAELIFKDRASRQMAAAAAGTEKLSNAVKTSGQRMVEAGSRMQMVGMRVTTSLTVPIVAMATIAVRAFLEFDTAMRRVAAATNLAGSDMNASYVKMKNAALEASKATVYSAAETADGLYELASAGMSAEDAAKNLLGTLRFAEAANLDVGEAALFAASQWHLWGDAVNETTGKFYDMKDIFDITATAVQKSESHFEDFTHNMKLSGIFGKQAGQSYQEMAVAMMIAGDKGANLTTIGFNLRQSITQMMKPSAGAAAQLKELGDMSYYSEGKMKPLHVIAQQLRDRLAGLTQEQRNLALQTLFNVRAGGLMRTLIETSNPVWKKYQNMIKDSAGATERMAKIVEESASGKFQKLKNELNTTSITMGAAFLPMVEKMMGMLIGLSAAFSNLSPGVKTAVSYMLLALVTLGPLVKVIGGLIVVVGWATEVKVAFAGALKGVAIWAGLAGAAESAEAKATQSAAVAATEAAMANSLLTRSNMAVSQSAVGAAASTSSMASSTVASGGAATVAAVGFRAVVAAAAVWAGVATLAITVAYGMAKAINWVGDTFGRVARVIANVVMIPGMAMNALISGIKSLVTSYKILTNSELSWAQKFKALNRETIAENDRRLISFGVMADKTIEHHERMGKSKKKLTDLEIATNKAKSDSDKLTAEQAKESAAAEVAAIADRLLAENASAETVSIIAERLSLSSKEQVKAFEQATDAMDGWFGFLEEAPAKAKISLAGIKTALASQLRYFTEYKTNMALIFSKLTPGALKAIESLEPAVRAGVVSALANAKNDPKAAALAEDIFRMLGEKASIIGEIASNKIAEIPPPEPKTPGVPQARGSVPVGVAPPPGPARVVPQLGIFPTVLPAPKFGKFVVPQSFKDSTDTMWKWVKAGGKKAVKEQKLIGEDILVAVVKTVVTAAAKVYKFHWEQWQNLRKLYAKIAADEIKLWEELPGKIEKGAKKSWDLFWKTAANMWEDYKQNVKRTANEAVLFWQELPDRLKKTGQKKWDSFWSDAKKAAEEYKKILGDIGTKFIKFWENLPTWLEAKKKGIVKSLASMGEAMVDAIFPYLRKIIDTAQKAWDLVMKPVPKKGKAGGAGVAGVGKASGGLVSRRGNYELAEAGTEMVLPANITAFFQRHGIGGGGGGGATQVTIENHFGNGSVRSDQDIDKLSDAIQRKILKTLGRRSNLADSGAFG